MKESGEQIKDIFTDANRSNWEYVKFGDIVSNISERVEPGDTDSKIYVGLEHLDPDSIHIRRFGSPSDVKGTKLRVYKGDIIFGKRRAYQRKASIADFDGICSAHAMVLRANPEKVDPRLLPFFLHSEAFMSRAIEISEGSLSPTIKWVILEQQKFRLPPRPIQEKIAELLWKIDTLREATRRGLTRLQVYKRSFLEKALLSSDGPMVTLKDLGIVIRGVGYKPEDVGYGYSESYYPILRSNNIQDDNLNFDNLNFVKRQRIKDSQILREGDIFICMSNGSKELVGKAALFTDYPTPIAFGSFCATFRPHEGDFEWLVKYLFQTESYRRQIKLLLTGSNINNLKPSDIEIIHFRISKESGKKQLQDRLIRLDEIERRMVAYSKRTGDLARSIINQL